MTDDFKAATDRMRGAAAAWEIAAWWLSDASNNTASVTMTGTEAGVFAPSLMKYQPAPGYVKDRLAEGAKACQDIADTLKHAASTYDQEDAARARHIKAIG
ncbi:type VII secretion target [Nocardia mangyaensis]|uniref:type VII secretion target n=1 Tax=Nocardia mangyaensis TaxID=2213200 RepID=UPI0026765BA0|nr:type VII secretion target [Nocardia mangyaensis]MDO3648842.1 type VII secretion target [Nocardia mangyaensis]